MSPRDELKGPLDAPDSPFDALRRREGQIVQDGWWLLLRESERDAIVELMDAAKAFVATTSVFRQNKASRDEFERMAVALIALGAYQEVPSEVLDGV